MYSNQMSDIQSVDELKNILEIESTKSVPAHKQQKQKHKNVVKTKQQIAMEPQKTKNVKQITTNAKRTTTKKSMETAIPSGSKGLPQQKAHCNGNQIDGEIDEKAWIIRVPHMNGIRRKRPRSPTGSIHVISSDDESEQVDGAEQNARAKQNKKTQQTDYVAHNEEREQSKEASEVSSGETSENIDSVAQNDASEQNSNADQDEWSSESIDSNNASGDDIDIEF